MFCFKDHFDLWNPEGKTVGIMKNRETIIMIGVVLFTALVRGIYAFSMGSFMGDDSAYYIGQVGEKK